MNGCLQVPRSSSLWPKVTIDPHLSYRLVPEGRDEVVVGGGVLREPRKENPRQCVGNSGFEITTLQEYNFIKEKALVFPAKGTLES